VFVRQHQVGALEVQQQRHRPLGQVGLGQGLQQPGDQLLPLALRVDVGLEGQLVLPGPALVVLVGLAEDVVQQGHELSADGGDQVGLLGDQDVGLRLAGPVEQPLPGGTVEEGFLQVLPGVGEEAGEVGGPAERFPLQRQDDDDVLALGQGGGRGALPHRPAGPQGLHLVEEVMPLAG
jgi:hypothetical protein